MHNITFHKYSLCKSFQKFVFNFQIHKTACTQSRSSVFKREKRIAFKYCCAIIAHRIDEVMIRKILREIYVLISS